MFILQTHQTFDERYTEKVFNYSKPHYIRFTIPPLAELEFRGKRNDYLPRSRGPQTAEHRSQFRKVFQGPVSKAPGHLKGNATRKLRGNWRGRVERIPERLIARQIRMRREGERELSSLFEFPTLLIDTREN